MKNLRKDQWLTIAIVGVVVTTFALVFYLPQRRRLSDVQEQQAAAQSGLNEYRAKLRELTLLKGEMARAGDQFSFYDRRLPDLNDVGPFVKDISNYAQLCGLEQADYRPAAQTARAGASSAVFQQPIEMRFKGNFAELFRFLRQARCMPRLTRVPTLTIHNDAEMSGKCTVEMTMNIYFTRG